MKKASAKKSKTMPVTNEDIFALIDERFDALAGYVVPEIGAKEATLRVEKRVTEIDKSMRSLASTVDMFAKQIAKFDTEYHTLVFQANRYEKWFRILAEKANVKLEAY
jgi:hypothetical protein